MLPSVRRGFSTINVPLGSIGEGLISEKPHVIQSPMTLFGVPKMN